MTATLAARMCGCVAVPVMAAQGQCQSQLARELDP